MSQVETFLLTHEYEDYDENSKPYLVRSKQPINTPTVDLLIFYVQTISCEIDESYGLSSDEVTDILVEFYEFEMLGQFNLNEIEKELRIAKPWIGRISEPHCTVIDIYHNWEKWVVVYDIIHSVQSFHRDGLKEYLEKLIQKNYK